MFGTAKQNALAGCGSVSVVGVDWLVNEKRSQGERAAQCSLVIRMACGPNRVMILWLFVNFDTAGKFRQPLPIGS
jgi:hypothetical protein